MDFTTRKQLIGARFRELRTQNNMTTTQLAKLLNLKSRSSISDFEGGRTSPSVEVLISAAGLFHVSADYLLGLEKMVELQPEIPAETTSFKNI